MTRRTANQQTTGLDRLTSSGRYSYHQSYYYAHGPAVITLLMRLPFGHQGQPPQGPGNLLSTFTGHTGKVLTVACSPLPAKTALSASSSGQLGGASPSVMNAPLLASSTPRTSRNTRRPRRPAASDAAPAPARTPPAPSATAPRPSRGSPVLQADSRSQSGSSRRPRPRQRRPR